MDAYVTEVSQQAPRLGAGQQRDLHGVVIGTNIIKIIIIMGETVFAYVHWKTTGTDDDKLDDCWL